MIEAIAIGFVGGVLAGLLGVGGGILFVPGLVLFLHLSQVDAEATSLLAIFPVAVLGAWRQRGYGNVRLRDGLVLGLLGPPAAALGVVLVNALPQRTIEVAFALLMVVVAVQLVLRTLARDDPGERS